MLNTETTQLIFSTRTHSIESHRSLTNKKGVNVNRITCRIKKLRRYKARSNRTRDEKKTTYKMLMVTKHLLFHVHKRIGLWLEIVVRLAHSSNRNSIGAGQKETEREGGRRAERIATTKISNCMQFKITYEIRLPHK